MILLNNFSIKNKLIAMMMLVSLLAIILGFSFVIINDIKTFKQDMVETALMHARLVGEYCIAPLDFEYDTAATEVLQRLGAFPTVNTGIVYDEDGEIFASYYSSNTQHTALTSLPEFSKFEFRKQFLHVYQPIVSSGKKYGTVYLQLTTEILDNKIRKYLVTMGLLILSIIFISFITASNLQKILSKPIVNLAHTTKSISSNADYSLRMHKQGDDEIGQLYDGFNEMLKQIELRDSELQQKNRELESLINTSPDAIIITDVHSRIQIINQQFIKMSGLHDVENATGSNLLDFIKPDDVQQVSKELRDIFVSGNVTGSEFSILHNEGKEIPVELNASILSDEKNNPQYIINIIRDITERKILEENISRLRREHETFMRHEIKNIIFPIQGFAEILLLTENEKLDENQKNYLQLIRDDSLRAGQLIDRLKMLQDIEKGEFTLNLKKYPLKRFIEKAIVELKILSDVTGVSITRDFRECPDINVDANLIQGVFTNLLKNAIEHVQDCTHEEEKNVTVALYPHKGKTIVTFNNKGKIIPPDKLKVFFEKFNTDRTKKKDGTGLGTTYAYLITKAHGGDIAVESNENAGTTVTVIFNG